MGIFFRTWEMRNNMFVPERGLSYPLSVGKGPCYLKISYPFRPFNNNCNFVHSTQSPSLWAGSGLLVLRVRFFTKIYISSTIKFYKVWSPFEGGVHVYHHSARKMTRHGRYRTCCYPWCRVAVRLVPLTLDRSDNPIVDCSPIRCTRKTLERFNVHQRNQPTSF